MEKKPTRDEFIKFLIDHRWWDLDYFYEFSKETVHLEDNVEFNEGLVMVVFKYPKNGGTAISSYYRVIENEDDSLKMYINSKYGTLSIKEHFIYCNVRRRRYPDNFSIYNTLI